MKKDADILNVILIVISLFLAFKLPFELFLFSYAVLGPMHYLTEISWLREKNYFVKDRKAIWILVGLVALLTFPMVLQLPIISAWEDSHAIGAIMKPIRKYYPEMVLGTFLFAIGLVHLTKRVHLAAFFIICFLLGHWMLRHVPGVLIFTTIFLPTVIHVYLFTMLFMTYGTLQTKSTPGIWAIVLLIAAPIVIFTAKIDAHSYQVGSYAAGSFTTSGFGGIHKQVHGWIYPGQQASFSYLSALAIKVQIFLAFAYTYHYLNWFSKTNVIGWHRNLSRKKIAAVFALWAFCIGIYAYDYKTGIIALTFLSLLHVILEFPLNITSAKGVCRAVSARVAG